MSDLLKELKIPHNVLNARPKVNGIKFLTFLCKKFCCIISIFQHLILLFISMQQERLTLLAKLGENMLLLFLQIWLAGEPTLSLEETQKYVAYGSILALGNFKYIHSNSLERCIHIVELFNSC